jgi:hypothetical protein
MPYTVTATQGGATANGMLLRLLVLTGAAVVQNGASGTQSAAAAHTVALMTTVAGSVVWSVTYNGNDAAVDPSSGNTALDAVLDTTNDCAYATLFSAATVTPGSFTAGVIDSFNGGCAAMEVLPKKAGTPPAVSGTGPAAASTLTATTVTTASFSPPAGALLLALVSANGTPFTGNPTTVNVAASGLVFSAVAQANALNNQYAGIFTAHIPSSGGSAGATGIVPVIATLLT